LLQISTQNHHIYSKNYCSNFPKSSVIKRTQKKAIKRQTQILAEICQNRTSDKGRIFEGFSVAQIKKCSTNESLYVTWGICTRKHRSKIYTENLYEFLRCSTENCFRTATSPNLYLTRIRGFSWHKNKIKRVRSGHILYLNKSPPLQGILYNFLQPRHPIRFGRHYQIICHVDSNRFGSVII
jgi:hypothetical protein